MQLEIAQLLATRDVTFVGSSWSTRRYCQLTLPMQIRAYQKLDEAIVYVRFIN